MTQWINAFNHFCVLLKPPASKQQLQRVLENIFLTCLAPWQKSNVNLTQTKKDKQIRVYDTALCYQTFMKSTHFTGFKGQTFLQFQKGQQCYYCIAVNDKQKVFLPQSVKLNAETVTVEQQPFKPLMSGCDRNVASSTLAWFLTLCSQSQRQTVLIFV